MFTINIAAFFLAIVGVCVPSALSCVDSSSRFRIVKPTGKKIWRGCAYVARNAASRCNFDGASETCPVTCNTCDVCVDSPSRFKIRKNDGRKISRDCTWVATKPNQRCSLEGVTNTCRQTCGACDIVPTSPSFVRQQTTCQNSMLLQTQNGLSEAQCTNQCENNSRCTAVEFERSTNNECRLFLRCDGEDIGGGCPQSSGSICTLKRKRKIDENNNLYTVKACVADGVGQASCTPVLVSDIRFTKQSAPNNCEETEGQKGSVTYVDLTLPAGKALLVEITTNVQGQSSQNGFFVRPTRKTRNWGKPDVANKKASFYLAESGQYSVEFVPDSIWRNQNQATTFDALMLFVNPAINLPSNLIPISPGVSGKFTDLGPNKDYLFVAGLDYDWGKDYVFKVHDNTSVYFEKGAHVRARIVQTEKKVNNILLKGYGTLDAHYDLEYDEIGISDDATRQNVGIYGKNIRVNGLTLINTNPTCGLFGYCLNFNANWSPLTDSNTPFDAFDLQLKDPPFAFRQAHCQENNMDDSPNTDFSNCPTSHANGNKASYVKCMTWQLGHDGLNAGKWGTVENSFVRTVDDAIKPWDSHGIYTDITIWQLTLGWPINFGWWNWNQPDVDTVVDSVNVIHNHNWVTSPNWPETQSGQCVVGGIYGSGAVKQRYQLSNIFVETAASCAVGLQISKNAYSRHPTPEGCVGSMLDIKIDGMYFDEEFYQTGGYNNFLSGETNPNQGCTGELSGKIENMSISGLVAGRPLSRSDFIVNTNTVPNLSFGSVSDPNEQNRTYQKYTNNNAYEGSGGREIDVDGVIVRSYLQCLDRCQSDWSCECVVYSSIDSKCWKRGNCVESEFDNDNSYDVYMRQWG